MDSKTGSHGVCQRANGGRHGLGVEGYLVCLGVLLGAHLHVGETRSCVRQPTRSFDCCVGEQSRQLDVHVRKIFPQRCSQAQHVIGAPAGVNTAHWWGSAASHACQNWPVTQLVLQELRTRFRRQQAYSFSRVEYLLVTIDRMIRHVNTLTISSPL